MHRPVYVSGDLLHIAPPPHRLSHVEMQRHQVFAAAVNSLIRGGTVPAMCPFASRMGKYFLENMREGTLEAPAIYSTAFNYTSSWPTRAAAALFGVRRSILGSLQTEKVPAGV